MSATYDESKHNRAGDGKFATKDGGREAAGQVELGEVGDTAPESPSHPEATGLPRYVAEMDNSIDSARERLSPPKRRADRVDSINRDLGMSESEWKMPDGSVLKVKDAPDQMDRFLRTDNRTERYTLDKETGEERYSRVAEADEVGTRQTVITRKRSDDGTVRHTHESVDFLTHSSDTVSQSPDGSMVHTSFPNRKLNNDKTVTALAADGSMSTHRQSGDEHVITISSGPGDEGRTITYTDPTTEQG